MHTNYLFSFLLLLSVLAASCTRTDGEQYKLDPLTASETLGMRTCSSVRDCGAGRYCNEDHLCAAECGVSKDCYFKDEAAIAAWAEQKARGISFTDAVLPTPAYYCSECGTCTPMDQVSDERCLVASVSPCQEDVECQGEPKDERNVCSIDKMCSITCDSDDDCLAMGIGQKCLEQEDRKVCVKFCYNDSTCYYHGFNWRCLLPDDVDPDINYYSDTPTYGRCIPRDGGVDWGDNPNAAIESYKLVGVYGAVLETAYTNCGLPLVNCQNTTNIHHMLFRIRQTANGVEMHGKYCYQEMRNFKPSDTNPTKDVSSGNDELAWMEVPTAYHLVTPLHHWTIDMNNSIGVDFSFRTNKFWEVRGAKMTHIETDTLPTIENGFINEWDQDRDGQLGITTVMNGILTGEIYQAVRFWEQATPVVVRMTDDGSRVYLMQGLINNWSETAILGASKSILMQATTNQMHENRERTYIRMIRMADTANCKDVLTVGRSTTVCGLDFNERKISIDDPATWLCHSPTVNGVQETAGADGDAETADETETVTE